MEELEHLFGTSIPDIEFVIATSDRPMVKLDPEAGSTVQYPPVIRFCTSEGHADIAAPIFHFYSSTVQYTPVSRFCTSEGQADITAPIFNLYSQLNLGPDCVDGAGSTAQYTPVIQFCTSEGHADIAAPILAPVQSCCLIPPAINEKYPWAVRQPLLFGRFSNYLRHIDPAINQTLRWGTKWRKICREDTKHTHSCKVRQHLMDVSKQHSELMDVKSGPMLPLTEHARYKYLVHVDGQALSSRMEQLMPLGSLIFKEESGYRTFYYHLIKPYEHYIPFWEKTPDNLFERLEWAKLNDLEAKKIAEKAQAFALKYLGKRTRACYWFKLLTEMSKLLKFKPGPGSETDPRKAWIPVRKYFETVATTFDQGKWYRPKIETFTKGSGIGRESRPGRRN
eukprot:gene23568-9092_t